MNFETQFKYKLGIFASSPAGSDLTRSAQAESRRMKARELSSPLGVIIVAAPTWITRVSETHVQFFLHKHDSML